MSAMARAEHLAAWMRGQVAEAGAQGLVVALSGGVDSAVVARLSQLAAPGAVIGVLLPCHSAPEDERDAAVVAGHLSLPTVRIDLAPAYDPLVAAAQAALEKLPATMRTEHPHDDPRARVPQANMKPRLRMTALYFIANSLNYLVAGTGNRSELSIGYFTKYGDGGVDILPLANLAKREVHALARDLGLPPAIIDRTPTAGLWPGQTDEAEMGFTYDQLERYLDDGAEGVAPALAMRIERLVRASEHKRRLPPSPPPNT
jgi:NAD+ synthase